MSDLLPGKILGFAAKFWQASKPFADGHVEAIMPNAFQRALQLDYNDIYFCFDHSDDENLVLSRTRDGTLDIFENSEGLLVQAKLPNSRLGRYCCEMVNCGFYKMSFRFYPGKTIDKVVNGQVIRVVEKVLKLLDVCVCVSPRYPSTEIFYSKTNI